METRITEPVLYAAMLVASVTPTPTPTTEFDPDVITPGPLGFLAIFLVAVAAVLLILDMVRRVRRVRYRGEVREEIAREQQERRDGE